MTAPDTLLFRHIVKCDRPFNARIERAARQKGVSVQALVQAHFDTMFDRVGSSNPDVSPGPKPSQPLPFTVGDFARRHDISVAAARLWKALRDQADDAGHVRRGMSGLGFELSMSPEFAIACRDVLVDNGLLVMVKPGRGPSAPTYRVEGA